MIRDIVSELVNDKRHPLTRLAARTDLEVALIKEGLQLPANAKIMYSVTPGPTFLWPADEDARLICKYCPQGRGTGLQIEQSYSEGELLVTIPGGDQFIFYERKRYVPKVSKKSPLSVFEEISLGKCIDIGKKVRALEENTKTHL